MKLDTVGASSGVQQRNPRSILIVHERFAPDFAGGGEYFVLMVAKILQSEGLRVKVLTAGDPAITEFEGIETQRLPMSSYRFNLAWRAVAEAATDVDLIHCFSYHSILPASRAAKKLNKPLVCGVIALFDVEWLAMKGPVLGRLFRLMEHKLLTLPADARIYISDFSHQLARDLNLDSPDDVVIEPGISLDEYWAAPEKNYVLFAGKMDVRKGVDVVFRAAAALPTVPFKMVVWGDAAKGPFANLPPNLEIILFESREHLAGLLAGARIFLFPTQAETFGLVVAEAMASGCAVVSTSPLPFAGRRIAYGDVDEAVAAIQELWADPQQCSQMAKENLAQSLQYNWQRHLEQLLAVYARVLVTKA